MVNLVSKKTIGIVLGLLSLAKPRGISVLSYLGNLEDLQLQVDIARRLRLAAIAHIYPILPFIVRYSCSLPRTTRVGVTKSLVILFGIYFSNRVRGGSIKRILIKYQHQSLIDASSLVELDKSGKVPLARRRAVVPMKQCIHVERG
jgi:hypothetical protein